MHVVVTAALCGRLHYMTCVSSGSQSDCFHSLPNKLLSFSLSLSLSPAAVDFEVEKWTENATQNARREQYPVMLSRTQLRQPRTGLDPAEFREILRTIKLLSCEPISCQRSCCGHNATVEISIRFKRRKSCNRIRGSVCL